MNIELPENLKELLEKNTRDMISTVNFMCDSGSYKERQKYKLSDKEVAQHIQIATGNLIEILANSVLADYILTEYGNKKQRQAYDTLKDQIDTHVKTYLEKYLDIGGADEGSNKGNREDKPIR